MEKIILRGRKVVGGFTEGEALVTEDMITGWGGVAPDTGEIIDIHHELHGQNIKDKILVFPGAKGSSGWSALFHFARVAGNAPKAMIFNIVTTKVALGAVVTRAPAVTELNQNPLEIIESGDWVKVDGDAGIIEVLK